LSQHLTSWVSQSIKASGICGSKLVEYTLYSLCKANILFLNVPYLLLGLPEVLLLLGQPLEL